MENEKLNTRLVANEKDIEHVKEDVKKVFVLVEKNAAIGDKVNNLIVSMTTLTGKLQQFIESFENFRDRTGARLEKIEGEPGQKWKNVTGDVIKLAVAAVAGGALGKLF